METIFALVIIAIVIISPLHALSNKKAGEGKAEFIGSTIGAFIGLVFCVYLFAWMIGLAGEFHDWFWGGIRNFLGDVEDGLARLERGIRDGLQVLFYLLGVALVMGGAGVVFHWISRRFGEASPAPKQQDWEDQEWESSEGRPLSDLIMEEEKYEKRKLK